MSRRAFLAGSAVVVVGACSDRSSRAPSTTATTPTTTATTTSTTLVGTTSTTATSTTGTLPATTTTVVELAADPFTLGVASGDPDADGAVLWTRLAPDPLHGGGMPDVDVEVGWEVATDQAFDTVVGRGTAMATVEHGHSVHAVAGLDEGVHWFRFRVGSYTSPVGRTQRAPRGATASATFASASCQNYEAGLYAAHRDIAAHQLDFVVWLGDYIYEGAAATSGSTLRSHGTPEPTTLGEYRDRYALYQLDPDLQAARASCPWFVIWDDHEVENDYAGLSPQDKTQTAAFPARRFAAYRAWWEHQPVRLPPPTDPDGEYRIYRGATWGDLLGLVLLDGRQYRTDQACGDVFLDLQPACPEVTSPGRTMTGDAQEQWLDDTLGTQGTTWNVVGNQVVFTDVTLNGAVLNYDQWDGYPAERERILTRLAERAIPNVVVLTGDIHLAAVGQLRAGDRSTGTPVGVEFVATSISSAGLLDASAAPLLKLLPAVVDAELLHRGYALHAVTQAQWSATYRMVTDVTSADSTVTDHATYLVDAGTNTVRLAPS